MKKIIEDSIICDYINKDNFDICDLREVINSIEQSHQTEIFDYHFEIQPGYGKDFNPQFIFIFHRYENNEGE